MFYQPAGERPFPAGGIAVSGLGKRALEDIGMCGRDDLRRSRFLGQFCGEVKLKPMSSYHECAHMPLPGFCRQERNGGDGREPACETRPQLTSDLEGVETLFYSAIGTLAERSPRFTMLLHLPRMEGHGAAPSVKNGPALTWHGADAVRDAITTLPEELRRSLTWDQGAEMAQPCPAILSRFVAQLFRFQSRINLMEHDVE